MRILVKNAGDMITKSHNVRARFQNQLYQNCRHAFEIHGIKAEIEKDWGRFYVSCEDDESLKKALSVLPHIYGIYSIHLIEKTLPADIQSIADYCRERYSEEIKGKIFAIRCKRAGKHAFSSQELCTAVGAAMNHHYLAKVDLKKPDWILYLDVSGENADIFSETILGPSGLPLKTAGKAVCLMSGGFDSPLAAWYMQKRGVELVFLFCNLAGKAHERSVIEVLKKMTDSWNYGTRPVLYILNFEPITQQIKEKVLPQYAQVVLKRIFYLAAEKVAKTLELDAIITGEVIGQVSSQTLRNLHAIEQGFSYPILRPLIGFDKHDIMEQCKKIGTYELSASIKEVCQLVPDKPVLSASIEKLDQQLSLIDLNLLDEALAGYKMIEMRKIQIFDLMEDYLFLDHLPQDAVLVDCRSKKEFDQNHKAGAIHIAYDDFSFDSHTVKQFFNKEKKYVIYCHSGIMSAFFAEKLQLKGIDAYCLRETISKQ